MKKGEIERVGAELVAVAAPRGRVINDESHGEIDKDDIDLDDGVKSANQSRKKQTTRQ